MRALFAIRFVSTTWSRSGFIHDRGIWVSSWINDDDLYVSQRVDALHVPPHIRLSCAACNEVARLQYYSRLTARGVELRCSQVLRSSGARPRYTHAMPRNCNRVTEKCKLRAIIWILIIKYVYTHIYIYSWSNNKPHKLHIVFRLYIKDVRRVSWWIINGLFFRDEQNIYSIREETFEMLLFHCINVKIIIYSYVNNYYFTLTAMIAKRQ